LRTRKGKAPNQCRQPHHCARLELQRKGDHKKHRAFPSQRLHSLEGNQQVARKILRLPITVQPSPDSRGGRNPAGPIWLLMDEEREQHYCHPACTYSDRSRQCQGAPQSHPHTTITFSPTRIITSSHGMVRTKVCTIKHKNTNLLLDTRPIRAPRASPCRRGADSRNPSQIRALRRVCG
jgi:hypothetical protein